MRLLFIFTLILIQGAKQKNLYLGWPNDFFQGVLYGIQVDPGNPSNCIQSYSGIVQDFSLVFNTFDTIGIHTIFNLIQNLNTFFSVFASSYDLCNYSNIAQKYFIDIETVILNILINARGF